MNDDIPSPSKPISLEEKIKEAKAIIFDFDGTLVDSLWVWEKVDRNFFIRHNIQPTPEYMKKIEGMSFHDCAKFMIETYDLKETVEEIIKEFIKDAEFEYANDVRFKEGAIKFIHWLKEKGIKYGIATSGNINLVNSCLKNNDAIDMFPVIFSTGLKLRSKPFPDVYYAVADELKVPREQCIVVEDTSAGILGAHNASMCSIHIKDEHNKKDWDKIAQMADFCIDGFTSINKALGI